MELVERVLDEAHGLRWRERWSRGVVMMIDLAFSSYHEERFSIFHDDHVMRDPYHWAFWVPFADEIQFQSVFCPACGNYIETSIVTETEQSNRRMMCYCE